jgi:adenylate cyclase
MLGLVQALRRRMVVRIFLAVGIVVASVLLGLAWQQSHAEITQLKAGTKGSAEQLAHVIVSSIETTMLQGDGIQVKNQVQRIKQALPDAEIHIYDPRGVEVFGDRPPAPARESLPQPLAATLADARARNDEDRELRPIPNETRCHECHPAGPALRGVLAVAPPKAPASREHLIGLLVENAFVQIMTAEQDGELTTYFAELTARAPQLRQIGVYGTTGDVAFGTEVTGASPQLLAASVGAGAKRSQVVAPDGSVLDLIPLVMKERCQQCHEPDVPVRGVLAVSLAPQQDASARGAELSTVIDTSLRYIMLSSLGRLISAFLDQVVDAGGASALALYDAEGRTYYTSEPGPPEPHIGAALATRLAGSSFVGSSLTERVRVVHPLINETRCARCHGSESPMRGAVSVSLSTRAAAEARAAATRRATLFIVIALAIVLVVLYTLLQTLVVSPVKRIGMVADAVGHGKLDVSVPNVDANGDEVQRLGSRINDMIRGLRTELHMRRFVSRSTVDAARGAAESLTGASSSALVGERRTATILFTDIRGFTAYSETVAPEQVVAMLNRFLQVQADIVERFQGDIDKYVGDELMAVFHGDDGPPRAVQAAIAMVAAVEGAREAGETLAVGAGISTGEVVHGPIGSTERMDFTVIGDVVNIGSRLCSAAQPSEVIISAAVREAMGDLPDVELEALEPLQLKGKRQPFAVYRVRSARRE